MTYRPHRRSQPSSQCGQVRTIALTFGSYRADLVLPGIWMRSASSYCRLPGLGSNQYLSIGIMLAMHHNLMQEVSVTPRVTWTGAKEAFNEIS